MRSLIDAALEDQMRRVLAMDPKTERRQRRVHCSGACGTWTYVSMLHANRAFTDTRVWTCLPCRVKP